MSDVPTDNYMPTWELVMILRKGTDCPADDAAMRLAADRIEKLHQQITSLCDGVNRRCGFDNKQLPLVSIDRRLAQVKSDRARLVVWMLHAVNEGCDACISDDCPHENIQQCAESILARFEADEAARAAGGGR